MADEKRLSLAKPTLSTPFHIDFSWWQQNDQGWQVALRSLLCSEHLESFDDSQLGELIDWVDPETAEVRQVDALHHILITHCSQEEDFLGEHTTLVESIFRLFMKNGNSPMTVEEIAEKLDRTPTPILRTLSGARVYRGIRPILN